MIRNILLATSLAIALPFTVGAQTTAPVIEVLKQASCGCCGGWVERMEQAGFTVNVQNVSGEVLDAAKVASGFSQDLWACHTASVGGYTVEGHVPASEIRQLLAQRPAALGIATPGMPMGSPGMEYGTERDAFDVVLVNLDGSTNIYATYSAK